MAKRAEQLNAMAALRNDKVPVCVPEKLTAFSARLIRYKELRATKPDGTPGKVYKAVAALEAMAHFAGMTNPITVEVDIEFGKGWGGLGELQQGVAKAMEEAARRLGHEYHKFLDSKLPAEDPNALPPLIGDRKVKPSRDDSYKGLKAARTEGTKKYWQDRKAAAEAGQTEAPAEQFDEAAQPNPETPEGGEA